MANGNDEQTIGASVGEWLQKLKKDAPWVLPGAGIGAAGGLASAFLTPRARLADYLGRTLLGAGLGAAGGYGLYSALQAPKLPSPPEGEEEERKDTVDKITKILREIGETAGVIRTPQEQEAKEFQDITRLIESRAKAMGRPELVRTVTGQTAILRTEFLRRLSERRERATGNPRLPTEEVLAIKRAPLSELKRRYRDAHFPPLAYNPNQSWWYPFVKPFI